MKEVIPWHPATPPMAHQPIGVRKAWRRVGFAYLMEQGTGKSLTFLAEALAYFCLGLIDRICILAPNGVHQAWILEQCEEHIPESIACEATYYVSGGGNRREKARLDALARRPRPGEPRTLRILAASFDSLTTDAGFDYVQRFVRGGETILAADESQNIKSPKASRTRRSMNVRKHAKVRRLLTGTLITNSPMDAFSQFEFLEPGLLGETTMTAFTNEYAHVLPPQHGTMRHIVKRMEMRKGRKLSDRELKVALPPVVAQDELGRPRYKNLERLHALIAEHSYRVLKEDCLDLPPKLYKTLYFHLTKRQREVYDRMEDDFRYILDDGNVLITTRLVALAKLRQITSGFLLLRDGTVQYVEDNPRAALFAERIEEETRQGLVWSQYKEEQKTIARILKEAGQTVEIVNGDTPMKRRREIRAEFQAGNLQWIDAHPRTMKTGYQLTKSEINFFYSNGFDMEERVQAEDRAHRIGTVHSPLYTDLVAIDTRDENAVWALQHKLETAAIINGDPARKSRFSRKEEIRND